jgi:hypothetical protein
MKEFELIKIPRIVDERGALCFVEIGQILSFPIERAYWIYETRSKRGGHAHKKLKQFLFCPNGSLDIIFDNCAETKRITLDKPDIGVLITGVVWREIEFKHKNSVLIVLASEKYDESDYIYSYEELCKWKSNF